MAVLAPVLERKLNTEDKTATEERRNINMTAEERHNACIKQNYARLINPDTTVCDVIYKETAPQQRVAEPVREQKPLLVENARTHSEIFCADSRINRRQTETEVDQEEENEDLRPTAETMETIKYKPNATSKIVIDDKISNKPAKTSKLTKRDKIVMAVALLVIVALFVLVIVNSAVLSNLNSEIDYLQSDLATIQENYAEVLQAKEAYLEEGNFTQIVNEFATGIGMVKIGR